MDNKIKIYSNEGEILSDFLHRRQNWRTFQDSIIMLDGCCMLQKFFSRKTSSELIGAILMQIVVSGGHDTEGK